MTQVTLTLNGRSYKFVCEPGEEAHFRALAAHLQGKVDSVRKQFGKVGDERILAMAALLVTDELFEVRAQAVTKSNEPAAMRMSTKQPARAARSQNKDHGKPPVPASEPTLPAQGAATLATPSATERMAEPNPNATDEPGPLDGQTQAAGEPPLD
jgi:cell division protein ZapA